MHEVQLILTIVLLGEVCFLLGLVVMERKIGRR